ncbi:MAG: hypothetical protein Q4D45_10485 [Lachnospiraceae bacterium]|nr:hypothetical protein [Lachnospiraceae bacterium]
MIVYFANRQMEILGQASTNLPKGPIIKEDIKTEEIETGIATFCCRIPFTKSTRKKAEECTEVGNYVLRSDGDDNEFYTIIDVEIDTESRDIYIYAEDAGLDLLNEIAFEYSADKEYDLTYYVNKYIANSGFEIGINESDDTKKRFAWSDESTVTERLLDIATQFGNYEISFSFDIVGLSVTHKYVNIFQKRGKDTGIQLRLNRDIARIITKKSVANLATSFLCTGSAQDGTDFLVTLEGYKYDDGDFYVDGHYLRSRKAVEKWGRYTNESTDGHIVRTFNYDTESQEELFKQALSELKKVCDIEVNYEVDITKLPDNVKIGDQVNIVDDEGELYLSARILKLETKITENTRTATLGEYLIKDSGISQRVEELATQFAQIAKSRTLYTWFAYADNESGMGITLNPEGKHYMGVAYNRLEEEPDLSDPAIYKWSKIVGQDGNNGISEISSVDQYYLSGSYEECIGGNWSEEIPDWESGKYIWKRKKVTWSDKTVTFTDPVLEKTMNHANEASYEAIRNADTAAQEAQNARIAAESADENARIASEEATNAKNLANTAKEDASLAQNLASNAKTAADEALSDVEKINVEVSDIRKDAVSIRTELQDQIKVVNETMETDYTKKTDTAEMEVSLKAEINKSAAEIKSIMSIDYAKKTDLTAVQENLQTQVTQNATNITSTASAVEEVKIDALNAQKKAEEANVAANSAQSKADNAVKAASDAQSAADIANLAAQNAREEATKAQTAANTAKTAAENAQTVADAAQVDLDEAKANLESITNRVGVTEEEIAVAQEAVDTAQKAADKANEDATNAKNAASKAQDTANKAQENAATAQSVADIANANATTAKTAADNAQKTADEANKAVGNLANTVTTMNTQIDQNAEAIELAATKEEVADYLSGYSTKAEMEAAIKVASDKIDLKVSTNDFNSYKTTVTGAINTAKSEAVNTAASDATKKANDALANAKTYTNSQITTVNESLSTTNQEISVMKGQIALKVEQTDIDTAVQSIEIGGRNIILNSDFRFGTKEWDEWSVAPELSECITLEGKNWLHMIGHSNTPFQGYRQEYIILVPNTEYVLSMMVYGVKESDQLLVMLHRYGDGNNDPQIRKTLSVDPGTPSKIIISIEGTDVGSKKYFRLMIGPYNDSEIYLTDIKLEKGNKATDWTPAPEDTNASITAVDNKFASYSTTTQMNSAITAAKDEINLSVSSTYATKSSVQEVDGKFANYSTTQQMNSAINQRADSILTTVEGTYTTKTDFDNQIKSVKASLELKVNKDTLISEINASADVITLTGNRFVVNSDNFKLSADGTLTAKNGTFTGDITATSGTIGGFSIGESELYVNSDTVKCHLRPTGISFEWLDPYNCSLTVDEDGMTGNNISISSTGPLYLDSSDKEIELYGNVDVPFNMYVGGTPFDITKKGLYVTDGDIILSTNSRQLLGRGTGFEYYQLMSLSSSNNVTVGHSNTGSAREGNTNIYAVNGYDRFIVGDGTTTSYLQIEYYENSPTYGVRLATPTKGKGLIGSTDKYFYRFYSQNSLWTSSDIRVKDNIRRFDERYEKMFDDESFRPCLYELKAERGKSHGGMISQEVGAVMEKYGIKQEEYGYFEYDPETDSYGLCYSELTPLNTHMLQKTRKELFEVENILSSNNARIEDLTYMLEQAFMRIATLEKENKKSKQTLAM